MEKITGNLNNNLKHSFKHQKKNKDIAFKGLTIETRENGTKHHTFYLPANTVSSNLKLEVMPIKRKQNGDYEKLEDPLELEPTKQQGMLKIWTPDKGSDSVLNINDPSVMLAYRFLKSGTPILDEVREETFDGKPYNLSWDPSRPDLKKERTIYHLMPDMLKPGDENSPDQRNHFNNFGGTIKDVINNLNHISEMGATRVLSTPVFNNGPKNSNGYWTKNPYQVDPVRGNIADFRTLQTELFKKGMGFIADGAFVNESWEGIHLKDVIKHEENSPFHDWFYVFDPDQKLRPELLPDKNNEQAIKNLGIKIINGDYKIDYDGDRAVVKGAYRDKNLPVRIQLFDRRFASKEQQNNDELIKTYDVKELESKNEVTSFSDAVQPVSFEVKCQNAEKALANKKDKKISPEEIRGIIKDTDWGRHFELAYPGEGSNVSPWDGQKDIMKLRFFVSEADRNQPEIDEFKLKKLEKASAQVQDNIVQVGQYWTAETEKTLSEYTAKKLSEKLDEKGYKQIDENNFKKKANLLKNSINELAAEGLIPKETAKLINQKQLENLLQSDYNDQKSAYTGKYELTVAPLPENITEGLMSQPLESIEFPDEVCSILASPYMKKLAHKPELIGVSGYELANNTDYKEDYSEYNRETEGVYKKTAELYSGKMSELAMRLIAKKPVLREKMVNDNDELSSQGKEIFRVIAGDITKYLIVKGLSGVEPDSESLEAGEALTYSPEKQKEIEKNLYKNWKEYGNRNEKSTKTEAESLLTTLKTGLNKIKDKDLEKFSEYLENRVKKLDKDTLKVSKLVLNKTESGLEWRIDAARDVADINSIQNQSSPRLGNTFNDSWDKVIDFWGRFIKGVKEQNPKYYAIAESSNLNLAHAGDPTKADDPGKSRGNYPTLGSAVQKFQEKTGFTTESNYPYLFSLLPDITKGSFEEGNVFNDMNKKLLNGWCSDSAAETPGFLKSAPVDSILYSHVFTDNHDMMRSLHALSINMAEFKGGLKPTKARIERWKGFKIADKLEILASAEEQKKDKLKGIKKIFDKAFGMNDKTWWIDGMDDDGRWNFVLANWKESWVENDSRIVKENLTDEYKEQKAQAEEELEDIEFDTNKINEKYAPAILAAEAILDSAEKAIDTDEVGISQEQREPLKKLVKKAVDNMATGSFKGELHENLPELFGRKSIKHNWRDIIAEAKHLDTNNVVFNDINDQNLKKLAVKVHQNFVKPGMERMKAVELYKTLFGSPTMYTGEETAETGLESEGKNKYLSNRHRVHLERLNPQNKHYNYVQNYKQELQKIFSLRKNPKLSPLVNGQTVMLPVVEDSEGNENKNIVGLYRYNKERDVIAIINAAGYGAERDQAKPKTQIIPHLDTSREGRYGVEGGIEDGVVYVNALNPKDKYITENGKLYKKSAEGNSPITIKEPALILYRKETF